MSFAALLRLGPVARISMGLVSLLMTLILLSDLVLGIFPSPHETLAHQRQRTADVLAIQITGLMADGNETLLSRVMQRVLAQDSDIRTITLRRSDGAVAFQRGEALAAMGALGGASTLDHMRVPVISGNDLMGEIDIRFKPQESARLEDILKRPNVRLSLVLSVGGFVLTYIYLRRAMQYLNPSATVPDRVRKAFDALPLGLVIVDQQSRVVLANDTFRRLRPEADDSLNGQAITSISWLFPNADEAAIQKTPWVQALHKAESVQEVPLTLHRPEALPIQLMVNCTPVTDGKGRNRGSMITFDDVSDIHRVNEDLRNTLGALELSRERIEEQNIELRRLASRDTLTGCFNRRAFFEQAGELFAEAKLQHTSYCCLMADIDHFKQFNDLYGHAVGDQVIQVVARALTTGLRQPDVLCRYGGEEFCIALPNTSLEDAVAVAERIRAQIETHANEGVRGNDVKRITSSFGVATLSQGATTLEELIDQADQALYVSKQTGRNRVSVWTRHA